MGLRQKSVHGGGGHLQCLDPLRHGHCERELRSIRMLGWAYRISNFAIACGMLRNIYDAKCDIIRQDCPCAKWRAGVESPFAGGTVVHAPPSAPAAWRFASWLAAGQEFTLLLAVGCTPCHRSPSRLGSAARRVCCARSCSHRARRSRAARRRGSAPGEPREKSGPPPPHLVAVGGEQRAERRSVMGIMAFEARVGLRGLRGALRVWARFETQSRRAQRRV